MMGGINRLIAAAVVALMCVGMWGCGDTYYEWSDYRSSKEVVGFVDDSLVMVKSVRCWSKYEESVFSLSDEEIDHGCGHTDLCVYNYRVQENGPRWCDSLDIKHDEYMRTDDRLSIMGQMTDSVVWGGNVPESIKLWKIGEKQHELKLKKSYDGCSVEFFSKSIKQWFGGSFIVRGDKSLNVGGDSCQYAILDTMAKSITYKRLEKGLEWIKKCDDVRAWGEDVYCFMPGEHAFEAILLRNGKDTVDVPIKFTVGDFWGSILQPNANLCNLINGQVVCFGVVWRGGLSFYQNDETVVEY